MKINTDREKVIKLKKRWEKLWRNSKRSKKVEKYCKVMDKKAQ